MQPAVGGTEAQQHAVGAVLAGRYGLRASELTRLPLGQDTVNYRALCQDGPVFVKCYRLGTDLDAEAAAIEQSTIAAHHGIPVPAVVPTVDGDPVERTAALSVWEWAPGSVVIEGLTIAQFEQAGAALGRIHRVFAALPGSAAESGLV